MTTTNASAKQWDVAVEGFLRKNPEFAKYGRPATPLLPRYEDPTKLFIYYITFQAIGVSSASAIWDRLVELVENLLLSIYLQQGKSVPDRFDVWPPHIFASIPDDALYGPDSVGLSKRKLQAIRGIVAYLVRNPGVYDPTASSDAIIRSVSKQVKGVGPFTVAHYLIEHGLLDVANVYDGVMRKGMMLHYGLDKSPTIAQARKLAADWGEFKTVGTKYMFYVANRPPRMPEFLCHIYELTARSQRR